MCPMLFKKNQIRRAHEKANRCYLNVDQTPTHSLAQPLISNQGVETEENDNLVLFFTVFE